MTLDTAASAAEIVSDSHASVAETGSGGARYDDDLRAPITASALLGPTGERGIGILTGQGLQILGQRGEKGDKVWRAHLLDPLTEAGHFDVNCAEVVFEVKAAVCLLCRLRQVE